MDHLARAFSTRSARASSPERKPKPRLDFPNFPKLFKSSSTRSPGLQISSPRLISSTNSQQELVSVIPAASQISSPSFLSTTNNQQMVEPFSPSASNNPNMAPPSHFPFLKAPSTGGTLEISRPKLVSTTNSQSLLGAQDVSGAQRPSPPKLKKAASVSSQSSLSTDGGRSDFSSPLVRSRSRGASFTDNSSIDSSPSSPKLTDSSNNVDISAQPSTPRKSKSSIDLKQPPFPVNPIRTQSQRSTDTLNSNPSVQRQRPFQAIGLPAGPRPAQALQARIIPKSSLRPMAADTSSPERDDESFISAIRRPSIDSNQSSSFPTWSENKEIPGSRPLALQRSSEREILPSVPDEDEDEEAEKLLDSRAGLGNHGHMPKLNSTSYNPTPVPRPRPPEEPQQQRGYFPLKRADSFPVQKPMPDTSSSNSNPFANEIQILEDVVKEYKNAEEQEDYNIMKAKGLMKYSVEDYLADLMPFDSYYSAAMSIPAPQTQRATTSVGWI